MQVSAWLYLLEQGLSAACLNASLGRIAGLGRLHPVRLTAVSLLAGWASLLGAMQPAVAGLMLLPALAAPLAAWPGIPRRLMLRICILHAALGMMLNGCIHMLSAAPFSPRLALPLACLALCLTPLLARRTQEASCVSVVIRYREHRLSLTALVDSGNLLRDPLTGLPVIVISRKAAARLLPGLPALSPGMRLIRIRTVSGSALMSVFRPSQLMLSRGGPWHEAQAIIGLCPDGYDGFQALVPSSLTGAASMLHEQKEEISP